MSNAMEPRKVIVPLRSADASGPDERPVFHATTGVRILAVSIVDTADKVGHGTNYGTYSLINKSTTGSGTGVVATRASDTPTDDNIHAYVAWPVTLAAAHSLCEITAGSVLSFKCEESGGAGSGDLTNAVLIIEYADGYGGGVDG